MLVAQRRGVDSDLAILEGSLTEAPLEVEGPVAAQEQLAQPPVPAFLVEEHAMLEREAGA